MSIEPLLHKGLAGVYADTTAISFLNPQQNQILYRGFSLRNLASEANFYQVAHLLLREKWPSALEYKEFLCEIQSRQKLPIPCENILEHCPANTHPVDLIKYCILRLGMEIVHPLPPTQETVREELMDLISQMPLLLAQIFRYRQDGIIPNFSQTPTLEDPTANFFRLCFDRAPDALELRALNAARILYAEHDFNAGTFAARIVASTGADVHGAIATALTTLKGPLHGGAIECIMTMLEEIGEPERVAEYIRHKLARRERIMGFGHRVYRGEDPRVQMILPQSRELLAHKQLDKLQEIANRLRSIMAQEKNLYANVDLPMAPVYYALGFAKEYFLPLIFMSRIVGIAAHILEQIQSTRLIRPLGYYVGPLNPKL